MSHLFNEAILSHVVLLFAAVLVFAALGTRRRRLQPRDVVIIDGRPHVVAVVHFRLNGPDEYAFELLGECLARTIRVAKRDMSLGQLLIEEGWRPPPEGGPR